MISFSKRVLDLLTRAVVAFENLTQTIVQAQKLALDINAKAWSSDFDAHAKATKQTSGDCPYCNRSGVTLLLRGGTVFGCTGCFELAAAAGAEADALPAGYRTAYDERT